MLAMDTVDNGVIDASTGYSPDFDGDGITENAEVVMSLAGIFSAITALFALSTMLFRGAAAASVEEQD